MNAQCYTIYGLNGLLSSDQQLMIVIREVEKNMLTKASKYAITAVSAAAVIGGGYYINQPHGNTRESTTITESSDTAKSTKKSKKMDINAIKSGNFSSVVGTWTNSKGDSFTFDKKGLVSRTYSGATNQDSSVYTKQVGPLTPKIQNNYFKTYLGPKDGNLDGPSAAVPFDFIPKGIEFNNIGDRSKDRIFSGQGMDDSMIFYRTDQDSTNENSSSSSSSSTSIEQLSLKEKQALALLGMPSGFESDWSKTTPDDLLNGKAFSQVQEGSTFVDKPTTFHGIKLIPERSKYVLRLQNIPSDAENHFNVRGVIYIDGDNITYKQEGTRVQGDEQESLAQTQGTASLSSLYKQYKGTDKLKKMENIIEN